MFATCRAAPTVVPGSPIPPTVTPTITPSPTLTTTPTATASPTQLPTSSPTPRGPVETTLIATGDVMLGRMVRTESENHGAYTWPFEQTRDFLSSADITLINLENPILDPCPKRRATLIFCAPPESVEALTYAGIDVANLANNHMLDKDIEGYASTLDALDAAGIQPSDADHLVIIDRGGVTFGFIGFNRIKQYPDSPMLTEDDILTRIAEADRKVDVLVVSMHWGIEFRNLQNAPQIELAHKAIDAGADLIIGNHPHVVQGEEMYHGKLILYALGNFVFDDMSVVRTRKSRVAVLKFSDDVLVSYDLLPATIYDYGQPKLDGP